MSNFSNGDGHIGRNIDLGVFTVVNTEAKVVFTVARSMAHRQHASVLGKGEIGMFFGIPVEFLVRQIPIVEIVDVNSTDFRVW